MPPAPKNWKPVFTPVPEETLRQKQWRFVRMLNALVQYAESMGYELSIGDGFRDPRVHGAIGEKVGYGHPKSAHKYRLAQDYNLFLGGKWLDKTADFEPLGLFWESIGGTWGGRFQDGNHFSLEHEGIK
jgi:D-alanyl-D-alanine carboxypeptidase